MTRPNKAQYSAPHLAGPPASCPTCEFERGNAGRPQLGEDGMMICITCNSKWRELGGAARAPEDPAPDKSCHQSGFQYSDTGQNNTSPKTSAISMPANGADVEPTGNYRRPLAVIIAAFAATAMTLSAIFFIPDFHSTRIAGVEFGQFTATNDRLILADIKIEHLENSKAAIWVISAKISNPSSNFLRVPAILMRSGVKGSSGYIAHTYQPALQMLAPGANLIIRTSVQKPIRNIGNVSSTKIDGQLKNGIVLEFVGTNQNSG